MYLSILFLPLLGSIVSGFLGRKIGVTGSHIITTISLFVTSVLATIAFYEVGICGSPVSINLLSWIDSELLSISWGFLFDSLTVSMIIPISFISFLVHIYSISYMNNDPHNQRFFSFLSLFTFFMLVLVSGDSYLTLFIGWEGILECLKWGNINNIILNIFGVVGTAGGCLTNKNKKIVPPFQGRIIKNIKNLKNNRTFHSSIDGKFLTSSQRIGPHNIDVLSIIIGSTLGDTHLEKRQNGLGTRIIFEQSNNNVEYLMWFHSYLSTRGYCSKKIPDLKTRIKKHGIVAFHYRINSYTFSSLNWLHSMFYVYNKVTNKYVKIIPSNIEEYLTPLALAIWFMDDGSKLEQGAKIATNCFTYDENIFLCKILKNKYNLNVTIHNAGKNKGYNLYINKNSMSTFSGIVKPHMLPSLHYKLGKY